MIDLENALVTEPDLENALVTEQQVGGLEVPVYDPVVVKVCHSPQQLLQQCLHFT